MSTIEAVHTSKSTPSALTSGMVLQRKCACGGSAGLSGECEGCKTNKLLGKPIQKKLAISEPGDAYEQEADRVAKQVVQMSPADVSRRQNGKMTQPMVQRRVTSGTPGLTEAPPIVHMVLKSPGQPLDPGTRSFFEPRFGHDFGQVRTHTGTVAEQSAREIHANAYTVGHSIAFGAGQFAPQTDDGRNLIAHELSHVVQQRLYRQLMPESSQVLHTSLMRKEIDDDEIRREEVDGENESIDVDNDPDNELVDRSTSQLTAGRGSKPTKKKQKSAPPSEERVPTATTASATALKALDAARALRGQSDPAIWFDSWGNDLRDNDLSGNIDDKSENTPDGVHYGKPLSARICTSSPSSSTDQCKPSDQSMIKVQYKVCIDIPLESYKAAGANVSTSRWIPTFFGELSKKPNWTVWKKPARPSQLLDGDIVAAANQDHQHAGIVETGIFDSVINLPGPTSSRKFHLFNPSGTNDMVSVPRILFESFLNIDWIARLNK